MFKPDWAMSDKNIINILMADDDEDDRYFFEKALKSLSIHTKLVTVNDGEQLLDYLTKTPKQSPNVLFLDINMPRKNGYECLLEIKSNAMMRDFPIVMYSTSLMDTMADMLFQNGAHYYLRKGDFADLTKYLQVILTRIVENNLQKPSKEEFVLNEMKVI